MNEFLTANGWRRSPSGKWTHRQLTPTKGSTSRVRLLTDQEAVETQQAWDALREAVEDIARAEQLIGGIDTPGVPL